MFTHLSEPAAERCLAALHAALRPAASWSSPSGRRPTWRAPAAGYLFVPHAAEPSHPQWGGGEMTYGETVITLAYVRERWSHRFELLHAASCSATCSRWC